VQFSLYELVKYADTAMYQVKEEDCNSYWYRSYFKNMTTLAFERLAVKENLRQTLENKEFKLYYRPQLDARSKIILDFPICILDEKFDIYFFIISLYL